MWWWSRCRCCTSLLKKLNWQELYKFLKMKRLLSVCVLLLPIYMTAQTDSVKPALSVTGYLELYYARSTNKNAAPQLPGFFYSFNRLNELNLNLAYIKAAYETKNTRANVAFAAGTYMNANLAAEPASLQNIFEASAGIKISKQKNIWLDAGILPSHIGFETAVGKDCHALTRSIMAENSPYYETGVKLSWSTANEKITAALLALNGWQRITRAAGNITPAWGHQLIFKPTAKIILNSSSFIGNDKPDSSRQMRYFHNFYLQWIPVQKTVFTAGFDMGAEQMQRRSKKYNCWYTPVVIIKHTPAARFSFTARAEYYADKKGVIITGMANSGLSVFSCSLNADYHISRQALVRTEARLFTGKNLAGFFAAPGNSMGVFTTSLSVAF
jgi:hypothetical protein